MASSDHPDIPNPPEQRPVPTLDELVEFLRTFACKYGFNISKRKGGRLRTRDGEEIMTSYVLFCPWESHNSNGGKVAANGEAPCGDGPTRIVLHPHLLNWKDISSRESTTLHQSIVFTAKGPHCLEMLLGGGGGVSQSEWLEWANLPPLPPEWTGAAEIILDPPPPAIQENTAPQ
ncbi:hypothetical protein N7453_011256 [Penicillium expansum]|nr:hypothetical protein N7453_011256 [Penicillium expansum]